WARWRRLTTSDASSSEPLRTATSFPTSYSIVRPMPQRLAWLSRSCRGVTTAQNWLRYVASSKLHGSRIIPHDLPSEDLIENNPGWNTIRVAPQTCLDALGLKVSLNELIGHTTSVSRS